MTNLLGRCSARVQLNGDDGTQLLRTHDVDIAAVLFVTGSWTYPLGASHCAHPVLAWDLTMCGSRIDGKVSTATLPHLGAGSAAAAYIASVIFTVASQTLQMFTAGQRDASCLESCMETWPQLRLLEHEPTYCDVEQLCRDTLQVGVPDLVRSWGQHGMIVSLHACHVKFLHHGLVKIVRSFGAIRYVATRVRSCWK
eukprot:5193058-Amphidinium_carterae.1